MSTGTTFKFVPSDETGTSQKRQQAQRACERCRKRKKRCYHTATALYSSSSLSQGQENNNCIATHQPSSTSPSTPTQADLGDVAQYPSKKRDLRNKTSPITRDTRPELSRDVSQLNSITVSNLEEAPHNVLKPPNIPEQEGRSSRFIGDLSPEGIFLAATSPDATRSEDSIGVWLTSTPSKRVSQGLPPSLQSASNIFYGTGSLVQKVLIPMLEQECLSVIPAPPRLEALSKIYFEKVHPILPVINENAYRCFDDRDPGKLLLQQGICLAASKNLQAREHLILSESDKLLSCREFGDKLSGAMRISIEMGLVENRIVVIQALTLMSQFVDNPVGEDITSQFCGRAVLLVQSLGLHIKGRQGEVDRSNTTLLCCVWAIDRMDAALYGRPVLMHERDIRQDLDHCFEQQEPRFRVFLRVLVLLDKVIELYRPTAVSGDQLGVDWDFPSFEDVVLAADGSHIGKSTLATIETLYHAVAILSCRTKTWQEPQRTSVSYLRQSLSTSILNSTISRDLQDQITLFPCVPYALSLSLSISYREMRHSKLPFHRARSRHQFQILCDALSELDGVFWSASTTSEMGKKLLKEMDRVLSTVSEKRPQQNSSSNGMAKRPLFYPPPAAENQESNTMQEFDPSVFETMGDVDLFGMFDPSFDLDGFDACLEGNLNPAFPSNFQ